MSSPEIPDVNLRVLYDFEYKTKDGRRVCITDGEKLFLIRKTNPDWWQVIRSSKERPFYVPAKYVEECSAGNTNETRNGNGSDEEKSNAQVFDDVKPLNYPPNEPNGNVTQYNKEEVVYRRSTSQTEMSPPTPHNDRNSDKECAHETEVVNYESPNEDVKRILFDKRKLWAVEELMYELTQKRDDDRPEPEPEPDYENIFHDEEGNIHVVELENSLPGKRLLDSDGNVVRSCSVDESALSDRKEHTGKSHLLSKHRSLSEESDKKDLSSDVLQLYGAANKDKAEVQDSRVSTENLDLRRLENAKIALEELQSKRLEIYKVSEVPSAKERSSVVSLDGVSNVDISSGPLRREKYSKVGLVKSDSGLANYSRVSVVSQDSVKGSRVDLSDDECLADDVSTRSQRSKKGPKIKQLSESLEKLAQQIQFGPAITTDQQEADWTKKPSRSFEDDIKTEISRSFEEIESVDNSLFLDVDNARLQTYPNKMFLNTVKTKLGLSHSSSFKTKKELEKSTRKKYLQDSEELDIRASVSGAVSVDPDFKGVAFRYPADPKLNPIDKKERNVVDQFLQSPASSSDNNNYDGFKPRSRSMSHRVSKSSAQKNSRENLDVIGEANILRDKPRPSNPESDNSSKFTKIAIGFQNPSYRPISHSLDNVNDPKVLAMHDMLCTDLKAQQNSKNDSTIAEKETEKKPSRWSNVRDRLHRNPEHDPKIRNFQILKNSIEHTVANEPSATKSVPTITIDRASMQLLDPPRKENVSKTVFSFEKPSEPRQVDGLRKSRSSTVVSVNKAKAPVDDEPPSYEGREGKKTSFSQRKVSNGSESNRSRSDSNTSDDAVLNGRENPRRTSLTRTNRVESIKERHQLKLPLRPPSPAASDAPTRQLGDGWAEYATHDGRTYYYCRATGDKSWKPPRRSKCSESEDGSSSPVPGLPVPVGWKETMDDESGEACFVHSNGAKWFSSSDIEGRVYFFEENSVQSSWTLPDVPLTPNADATPPPPTVPVVPRAAPRANVPDPGTHGNVKQSVASIVSILIADKRREEEATMRTQLDGKPMNRIQKTRSMVLVPPVYDDKSPTLSQAPNWPDLDHGNMKILRTGPLYRTKITDHGKKVRKSWSQSYVVLTELMLNFYTDMKYANGTHVPELSTILTGANIERADKLSSRKNVFVINAQLGHQVLIQCDNSKNAEEWYKAIHEVIAKLPQYDNSPLQKSSPEEIKKMSRLGRSRSMKVKNKEGSMEDLTANPDERQSKIRDRLKKFFVRRPTKESLVKKGIYKDEPMFGRNLSDVIIAPATVPLFVSRCVEVIESKEENMKADGLYRVSGNLSQVQKIRLQADQNNLTALDQEEDVHVLTGALKLFFRELKKPLIPYEFFSKALKASSNPNKEKKISQFRDIVKSLPTLNRSTLQYLLQHLLRVTKFRESNRMHIANIAIVFGPTLMWSEEEELGNMAIDLMQQNFVIECLLQEYDNIFR